MEASFPFQDAWTRAKKRYVEDLTEEEKQLYYQATPETLFYDASAAQKKYTAQSATLAISERLQPLREAIAQYGQALDVYSNAYPLVLSPLWGSIRVVLHIAGEFGKYFEKLVEMFTRIGDVLPRFRVYERLFSNHERLVQALSLAYVDIVSFCSKCKAVFRHGQRSSTTSFKVTFKLTWKPFERQFGQYIEAFRQHRKNVEKEAGLSHMIEAADSRALVVANQMQIDRQEKEDLHRRTLAAIPSVDTKAKHVTLQGVRYPGTGSWLFQDPMYVDWQGTDSSSYLCCHGIPGCGKSVLASMVVDATMEIGGAKVLYYYCDYTDQRTLQINRILGTILKQLFTAGQIPDEIALQVIQVFGDDSRSFTSKEMVSLVCSVINLNSAVTIVLDGLDESLGSTVVKLFVSCREEDNILRSLTKFSRIHVTSAASEGDINSFISGSVRSRIAARLLKIRNPKLEQEIVSSLMNKANGMFLWVFFQLNELCEAPSDAEIRETLSDLPDGIFKTYERIISKISSRKKRYFASKIFTWIMYAQRPLKVAELQEAVAFDIADRGWEEAKIPNEDLMIESCRSLIVRDKTDNTVRFAHYTVQQYLRPKQKAGELYDFSGLVFERAPEFLGRMCITYLNFSDFETQITLRKPAGALEAPGILRSGGPVRIPSILGVGKSIVELVSRLSGLDPARSAPAFDWTRYLKPRNVEKGKLPAEYATKYALLQYVIEFWVFHTKYIASDSEVCQNLRYLVCNKTLPFEFRPWGRNQHLGPYGCVSCPTTSGSHKSSFAFMSLFHYAAEAGHWPLMEPYAGEYCAHERYTDETLLLACRYGQGSIVEKLLRVHKSDNISNRALNVAAAFGHANVLKPLLSFAQHEASFKSPSFLDEALILAVTNGHEEAVGLLMADHTNRGIPHILGSIGVQAGRTALSSAAANGHELIVKYLLKSGVKWGNENVDRGELSPLIYAAENGHASIVRALWDAGRIPAGPSYSNIINATDAHGESAIHKAAAKGHVGIVITLLEFGAVSLAPHISGKWTPGCYTRPGTPIQLAAASGHEAVVLVLMLEDFQNLCFLVSGTMLYRYEEMVRKLLESEWKHFERSPIEFALRNVPNSDREYHTRMTALLKSTLAKIDAEGRKTREALSEAGNSDDRTVTDDLAARDVGKIDNSVNTYTKE